jgi:uncharacterized protein YdaU (DUF1376 family)
MHYYQFHIGDYKSHTHHLTVLEDIAYRRLLDHYYLHEAPIKQRDIARQIGMRDHEQEVLSILNEFFVSTDKGFVSARADEEIAKYREMVDAGKRGAAKRWQSPPDSPPIAPPNATPIATINQEPITNNHKPKNTVAPPEGVTDSVWQDWKSLRKAKRAAVTQTAIDGIKCEAKKAGVSLQVALETCCARGWTGFKADWLKDKADAKSFAEKDYDFKRARWEAMTGRTPGQEFNPNLEIDHDTTH